jgi:AmmeMemoRadiSam system protein A
MLQLARSDRKKLVRMARAAIEGAVCPEPPRGPGKRLEVDESELSPALLEPAAAFVTLHEHGELRGCIGLLRYDAPVWLNVRDAAVAAALDDPRFRPVVAAEVPALEIEVSVLEPPVALPDPAGFVAGRHGIVVERGFNRALLLPQVATEQGWGAAEMLAAVCRKAGLPGDAWRDEGTQLYVFEAVCFGETAARTGSPDDEAAASV